MAFKNINSLLTKNPESIRKFLTNCTVNEKLNAHYVKVNIIGNNNITCNKGTGELVTQADIILNGMWRNYVEDWTYIKNDPGFKEFAKHFIGCTIGMYYFPCHNPLGTEYNFKGERCYVINQIYDNYSHTELSLQLAFNELRSYMGISGVINPDGRYSILKYNPLSFHKDKLYLLCDEIDEGHITAADILGKLRNTVNTESSLITNKDNLNFVFKHEKLTYQLLSDTCTDSSNKTDVKERTSYEFVLCHFVKFFLEHDMMNKVRGSYRNIVCYLFNEYITKSEKVTHHLENNINPSSIEPPYIGYNHGDSINHVYVPNNLTLDLCNENILYKNVFKLLLANLKVYKYKKYCVYMNDEQIGALNTIVHAIDIIKTDADPNKKQLKKQKYNGK